MAIDMKKNEGEKYEKNNRLDKISMYENEGEK